MTYADVSHSQIDYWIDKLLHLTCIRMLMLQVAPCGLKMVDESRNMCEGLLTMFDAVYHI